MERPAGISHSLYVVNMDGSKVSGTGVSSSIVQFPHLPVLSAPCATAIEFKLDAKR